MYKYLYSVFKINISQKAESHFFFGSLNFLYFYSVGDPNEDKFVSNRRFHNNEQ